MSNEERAVIKQHFEEKTANNNKKVKKRSRNIEPRTIHLKKSEGTASLYDWVHSLVFAVAIVVIILTFFLRLVDVSGTSMVPTLKHQDKVIVTNFFYTPKDGDIIVISHGAEYADPIIKRVIATEGQTLSIDFDKGTVKVDGKKLDEPYIQGFTHAEDAEIPEVIPKGKVFVMGDNRGVSLDSRSKEIGLIDVKDIIGKAQVVVFPFNSIKYLY
ncbi:MAG: signal peptidase I [Ruminococcus sp.]|nr:signal peptidase I [Ruminococcus sp.]